MRLGRLFLRVAPYVVYGAVVFGACLYVTFPYDLLAQYGAEHWAPPGVQIRATRVTPLFPPGLQVQQAALLLDAVADGQNIVQVSELRVRPSWLALAIGRPQAEFSTALYGGRVHGRVSRSRGEEAPVWDIEITLAGLELDHHPLTRLGEEAFLRGRLSGTLGARLDERGRLHAASVELNAEDLVFAGRVLQLPLQRDIACATLQSEAETETAGVGDVSLSCNGDDLHIGATGTVTWRGSVHNAVLDLRWRIRSQDIYRQEVNFLGALVGQELSDDGELSFRLYGPWQRLKSSG